MATSRHNEKKVVLTNFQQFSALFTLCCGSCTELITRFDLVNSLMDGKEKNRLLVLQLCAKFPDVNNNMKRVYSSYNHKNKVTFRLSNNLTVF